MKADEISQGVDGQSGFGDRGDDEDSSGYEEAFAR
jgi:hypothetical protein